ncbi:hypothetical protein AB833_07215 [Chromatiales bacterium (ex Bugula neritina AB1)]|nr:hypothetical protein AB833_07215 [Chromatiales bacterium (ex Bugula neritina AB1)]
MTPGPIQNYQPTETTLASRIVLITGAAGGLGSSIARAASVQGVELILLDKNERGLNALHDEIEANTGKQPGLYPLDLAGASADDYARLADTLHDVYGHVTGLVHCAANLGQIAPLTSIDTKLWLTTFSVNLHGPMLLTQSLLPLLKASGKGSVIFTVDEKCKAYWGSYGISKAAISAMSTTLADELDADKNADNTFPVTCNAINPGKMRTSLRSSAFPGEDPSTLPDPASKAAAYLYLLSSEARNSNGHSFSLDSLL